LPGCRDFDADRGLGHQHRGVDAVFQLGRTLFWIRQRR
jgi:hypothetical protein